VSEQLKGSLQLAVADLDTTEAFYGGILELPVSRALTAWGGPEHLVMMVGGWELIFVNEAAVARTHPLLQGRLDVFPKGVGMTLHFRVTEIEDIADAIEEEGLEILYPLEEKPYGVKEMWCFDPDGYLVMLEEPTR
jgi:catechol 2,3-dioxygenase-like lactoylglutathione lyase family enzyme